MGTTLEKVTSLLQQPLTSHSLLGRDVVKC